MSENRASSAIETDILTGQPLYGSDESAIIAMPSEPLFVINLYAAMTPIDLTDHAISGFEQFKLYQVSKMEDGRRRYRLRMGFFSTEAQAEDVLATVRARYATAFTSCLSQEDLKHATGYLKCTVADLERTGRYAVPKFRTGATARLRALDDTAIRKMRAAEAATPIAPPKPTNGGNGQAHRKPAPPSPPSAPGKDWLQTQPIAIRPSAAAKSAPRNAPQKPAAPAKAAAPAVVPPPAPAKRVSLMRQAHAMADVDAAERAKALAKKPADIFKDEDDALTSNLFDQAIRNAAQKSASASKAATRNEPKAEVKIAAKAAPQYATKSAPLPAKPTTTAKPASKPSRAIEVPTQTSLSASAPPAPKSAAPIRAPNRPFHVGAGIDIPETSLSLEDAPTAPTVKAVTPQPVMAPPTARKDNGISSDLMQARELAKQSIQWREDNSGAPSLDSTQTIRTLTKDELEDNSRAKWFVVQLAVSDQPVNLDAMPRLDIFEAYSVYSVAVMEDNRIRHALRLGFFSEEVSAMAVMGYLKTFFNDPSTVRIPDAEHERFANAPKLTPPQPSPNAVTLEDKPRPITPINIPTVNAAVERSAAMRTGSHKAMPHAAGKKTNGRTVKPLIDHDTDALTKEARMLGLSDTQIVRVQKNPSLLSRLLGRDK